MKITKKLIFKDENNNFVNKEIMCFSPMMWPDVIFHIKWKNKTEPTFIKQRKIWKDVEESGVFLASNDIESASIFDSKNSFVKKYQSICVLEIDGLLKEYNQKMINFSSKKNYKKLILSVNISNRFFQETFEVQKDSLLMISKRLRYKEFSIPIENFVKAEYI